RRRCQPLIAFPAALGTGTGILGLHLELGAQSLEPARTVGTTASTENSGKPIAGIAIVRALSRLALRAVENSSHPPGAAEAGTVAAGVFFCKQDCVYLTVHEGAGDPGTAVPNDFKITALWSGIFVLHPTKDQEIPRIGGVARTPVEAVAKARVAG